jgi:putative component of membrane protein insertase Oxa1/YidC/SpoIIIJ protein YidD
MQALEQYGAVKGTILAVHRVLRCNPWGGHGYDPPRWYGEPLPEDASVEPTPFPGDDPRLMSE